MEILTNAFSFVKSNWKNIFLCALIPAVVALAIACSYVSANNQKLKSALDEKTKQGQVVQDDLQAAQDELEKLRAQYSTMSEQVVPDNIFAYNGLDTDDGEVITAVKRTDGTIVYVDKNGEELVNKDGTPLTYNDVQDILDENAALKAQNDSLTTDNANLKESLKNASSNSGSSTSTPVTSTSDANTINTLASENEKLQNQVNGLTNKVNNLESANDALSQLNNTLSSELNTALSRNNDVANAALNYANSVTKDYQALADENAELETELAVVSADLDAYKEELVEKMNALSDAKLNTQTLNSTLDTLNTSLDDTQAQLEAVTTAYNELNGSIDSANILEAYREAVDNLNSSIAQIDKDIADINAKTEWSVIDQTRYDTLQAKIDLGDESLATIDEMAAEMIAMAEAHTLTDAEQEAITELETRKAELQAELETAEADLVAAEAQWLNADPSDSLDTLLQMDEALRTKIADLEAEIATKEAELAEAQTDAETLEAEMYNLKEAIATLEAHYNSLSLEEALAGSYENIDGEIDFGLTGGEEYNDLVASIQSMITSLKNRVNNLLGYVDEMMGEISNGLIEAGDDIETETETIIGDDGNMYDVKVLNSKLIHKKVNIVLFRGSKDQITIRGQMPYGQITRTSTTSGLPSTTDYFEKDLWGDSTGVWTSGD